MGVSLAFNAATPKPVIPRSLARCRADGASTGAIFLHILWRALALVAIGILLQAYPKFDWETARIPGVLQRIGVSYGLVSSFLLFTARRGERALNFSPVAAAGAAAFVLISYWALLYFVPVPGFGAPRFDPVGSWPAVIDRAVFTVPHLFQIWPVDGKVVFDPDGLLTTYSTSALILIGVVAGLVWDRLKRPWLMALAAGAGLMAGALVLAPICPMIKNIYSSTFVMFGAGFSLCLLGVLSVALDGRAVASPFAMPFKVLGANALLAFVLCFLLMPLLDLPWIASAEGPLSIRWGAHKHLAPLLGDRPASFLFALLYIGLLLPVLGLCFRKRWILKL